MINTISSDQGNITAVVARFVVTDTRITCICMTAVVAGEASIVLSGVCPCMCVCQSLCPS